MSNLTIARSYAKAVFNVAVSNNKLSEWNKVLFFLSSLIDQKLVVCFLKNKTISRSDKVGLLLDIVNSNSLIEIDFKIFCKNFLYTLSSNDRLIYLKDIYYLYKEYMNNKIGFIEVVVKVAYSLDSIQKEHIIDVLSKKFNKKVSASFFIDEKLLGGFLVKAGDFVLDASVLGNLVSLRSKILNY